MPPFHFYSFMDGLKHVQTYTHTHIYIYIDILCDKESGAVFLGIELRGWILRFESMDGLI